jgi:hypothetical protein
MTTFTDNEAERRFADVLARAKAEGEVRITAGDGTEFAVRRLLRSPLDVGFVKIDPPLTADEIVSLIHEGRDRG